MNFFKYFIYLFIFNNIFINSLNLLTKTTSSLLIGSTMFFNTLNENNLNNVQLNTPNNIEFEIFKNNFEKEQTYISTDKNNIYFYGSVTSESCRILGTKLNELKKAYNIYKVEYNNIPPSINLHIQSTGGTLINAFYIVDLIMNSDVPINTFVDGYSASAASLINVVGKHRYMTENSVIMIHQLYGGNQGKFKELDDNMINLNLFLNKIKKIYLEYTKITPDKLDEILEHDIWLDSKKCLKYGLIDEII